MFLTHAYIYVGTRLMVLEPEDDPDHIKEEVMMDMTEIEALLSRDARGVFVQASTIGTYLFIYPCMLYFKFCP